MSHRIFGLGLLSLGLALTVRADDSKSDLPLKKAGQIDVSLVQADIRPGGSVTVKQRELTSGKNGGAYRSRGRMPRLQVVEKDHTYDLANDVQVRWHSLPKGPDGQVRHYTQAEYQKLREPVGTPGYKAEPSDLHPGQRVRLHFGRAGKDDKPVVTVVEILGEDPRATKDAPAKAAAKPKK
jgi:hypothetical protein